MSNSVLARWDWPEARKEGFAPDEGELLPPGPQKSEARELKFFPHIPSLRSRELGCEVLSTSLKRVDAARRAGEGLYAAALALALGWRKWLGPHKLSIPLLPELRALHILETEPRAFEQLETQLGELMSWLAAPRRPSSEESAVLCEKCRIAADAFSVWLEQVGLSSTATASSASVPVPEPSTEDRHLTPLDERERPTVLAARERRLWEQLQAHDWSHRGRMSYARARQGAAAFEAKMVGILTAQGELRLAKDSERASRIYRDRAELSRGDREVRLTLLRLWAQTVCELHRWPLPTSQRAEPPSGSSNSNGSGWRGGNPGEPGSVFTIELKPHAAGAETVWDLPPALVPEPPLPPLPPFELETETPDKPAHSLKAEQLEPIGLKEVGRELDVPVAVMPAHSDPSPVEEAVKAPRPAKKETPKAAQFGSGVRHARVSIQWFPLVMGVMMLGQTACQHAPARPSENAPASPAQYPIELELMGPSYLPYQCARLSVECFPPLMERGTAIQLTKYCRNEGYTIEHCLW